MAATRLLQKFIDSNELEQWLIALAISVVVLAAFLITRRLIRTQHKKLLMTEQMEFMEWPLLVLSRTTTVFLVAIALICGLLTLNMPPKIAAALNTILTLALFWQAGIWVTAAVVSWIQEKQRASMTANRAVVGTLGIIALIVRVVIWTLVLLLTLDNLGVNITALVASLGVGGIAIALAVQNILGDLFASLSITLDKPFVVGDFLVVGDYMGSVEHIGVKSTRLRSLTGEQIIMANSDLLASRVRNHGRMNERRIVFNIGVTYETPKELVANIPKMIRDIVAAQPNVRVDRSHFAKFGASSLDYEIVYFVTTPDYNLYMDIQQTINLQILDLFEQHKIEFAYPTQTLHVVNLQPQGDTEAEANVTEQKS